jgi:hypothetical protein
MTASLFGIQGGYAYCFLSTGQFGTLVNRNMR